MNSHELVVSKAIVKRNEQAEAEFLQAYCEQLSKVGPLANLPVSRPTNKSPVKQMTNTPNTTPARDESPPVVSHHVELAPIRLDLDIDGYRLRDTLLWNLMECKVEREVETTSQDEMGGHSGGYQSPGLWGRPHFTPEQFADMACRDFDLPLTTFHPAILKSIRGQVQEHQESAQMIRNAGGTMAAFGGIRAIIKLDISVGFLQLLDRVEWDLGEERNDQLACDFATEYVRDLALPGEFCTAIAHDIIEQVCHLRRALLLVGFTRDSNCGAIRVNDPDLQSFIMAPMRGVRRDPSQLNEFTPQIIELDPLELERMEISRNREHRRRRRQIRTKRPVPMTAAGSETLAINMSNWTQVSPQKTIRTPLTYRGSAHRILNKNLDDEDDKPIGATRRRARK